MKIEKNYKETQWRLSLTIQKDLMKENQVNRA